MKILMVCLGNICRSPLAEEIMRSKLPADFYVDSAGTSAYHKGQLPDKRSIEIAKKFGLDLTKQRSRPITQEDLDEFDVIYCMDKSNYENVLHLAENNEQKAKIKLILPEKNGEKQEVPDPYFGGAEGFLKVYKMLDEACAEIASNLKK